MMRAIIVFVMFAVLLSTQLRAQSPEYLWAKQVGGTLFEGAYGVAVDESGNSYVVGQFTDSILVVGTDTLRNAGDFDFFIVKYNPDGAVLWATSAGGSRSDFTEGVAVDDSGNSYVAGYYLSPILVIGVDTLTNADLYDMFIVKYDPNGTVVWAKSAGGAGHDFARRVDVDGSGNSYVVGSFKSSSLIFDADTLTKSDSSDLFIVKYDPGGTVVWARGAGGSDDDYGYDIAVDGVGNSYVSGWFESPTITFGRDTLVNTNALSDPFIVKYDPSGSVLWAKSARGTSRDLAYGVGVDGSGNVCMAGEFYSPTLIFGVDTLVNSNTLNSDIFIVKYDSVGDVLWAKSAGDPGIDAPTSVTMDGSGNCYVVGFFESSTLIFGTDTLTNAGLHDIFTVKYDPRGNVLWAMSAGGAAHDYARDVAVDRTGNSYVVGEIYSPKLSFGTDALQNEGDADMFLVKIGQRATDIIPSKGRLPTRFSLSQNYPNPFNPTTRIRYALPDHTYVQLRILNVLGEVVATLVDGEQSAGERMVEWDATSYPSGVYFCKLTAGLYTEARKMLLVR